MAKTLHYDFTDPALSAVVGPTLDFTRATTATMVDSDGYIRTVQDGEARFPGATWRANLGIRSNDLSNGIYVKQNCTVAQDADGRDGVANTAWTVTADGAGAGVEFVGPRNDAVTSRTTIGRVILASWYAKPGTKDWIYAYNSSPGASNRVWFNVSTGTLGSSEATVLDYGIAQAGNGFYRCWLAQLDTDDNNRMYVSAADDDLVLGIDNSGAPQDVIILQDFMIEDVSGRSPTPSPSTYIETTTAPVSQLSGSSDGLLVEEARTNLCLQSEDLSTSWSLTNHVLTPNATTAPDGSQTADLLTDDGLGGGPLRATQSFSPLSTTGSKTFSAFVKADQSTVFAIDSINYAALDLATWFDVSTGTVGTTGVDVDDSGIEDFGNGWYRIWIAFTADGADTAGSFGAWICAADGNLNMTGDGTDSGFIWGAQLEEGAFPTSYIPTTTTSEPRNLDSVSSTDVSWASTGDATWYAQADLIAAGNNYLVSVSDNSSSDRFEILADSTGDGGAVRAATGGTSGVIFQVGGDWETGSRRLVTGWAENDMAAYLDGVSIGTDTTTDGALVGLSHLYVGADHNGSPVMNGIISEIRYYDERLDNDTLLDLSNGIFPAELRHKSEALRHQRVALSHQSTSLRHKRTTLRHEGG